MVAKPKAQDFKVGCIVDVKERGLVCLAEVAILFCRVRYQYFYEAYMIG
jgi:hypothetical protein